MRSGPRFILGAAALATSALVACGLDVVGGLGPASSLGDAAVPTEPETQAPERLGDGGEAPTFDASLPGETVIDAGPVDSGPCGPALFEENFAQGLASWTHYGGVEQGVSGGNAYARLIEQGKRNRAAGLFWLPTVKATSFKASFTYYVSTPSSLSKGDGLTFTWLTSKGPQALGTNAVTGQGFGLPPGVAGHAVALDGWQNLLIGDPGAPSLSLIEIDPSRGNPGSYDWHIVKKGPYYEVDLYDAWRTIDVVVANGKASATFRFSANGPPTTLFADVDVDEDDDGVIALGFTAGTGGVDAMGFFVDTVRFELTNASCD